MKTKLHLLLILLPLLLLGVSIPACKRSAPTQAVVQKYHCPMHTKYISDRPGDCPICNMKLVPIKDEPGNQPAATAPHAKPGQYYCPMHPEVISNTPGRCPECNMTLIQAPAEHSTTTPGRIPITLSPEKRQMIGVRYSTVEKRNISLPIRAVATLEHDETRVTKIAPRFSGWVQDITVNFTGQEVEKGQPLLTVYSPDLLSAQNEYLIASQRLRELKDTDPQYSSAQRLHDSARRKLTLWQIADQEIAAIDKTGKPLDAVTLRSPVTGHVTVKNAITGKAFGAGETLYEIDDLSRLWLRAYIYEQDIPLVKLGQKALITLPYLGNKTYESTVSYFYPHVEQQTRRAEIRLELDNPHHELRPQMWANVELEASYGQTLAVPASAVIDTGERYIAFVQAPDDRLDPREVKIGVQTDDYWQVLDGLNEGEKVVTRALFLIDSESQLKSAIAGMGGMEEHNH
jgi:membrane fusion protein, copper/silver efflux system